MLFKIVRSVGVFTLLLIFLAVGTGFTFFVHTCGSSHKTDVYVYKEVFNPKMSCCCDESGPGLTKSDLSMNYRDENCCRIVHLFIKAPFAGFPVLEKITLPSLTIAGLPQSPLFRQKPVADAGYSFIFKPDHSPPPISGTILVYFIHQIRIPSPVC